MLKTLFRIKKILFLSMLVSGLLLSSNNVRGYVMPAGQILDFMVKNFSGFRSITLIQSILQITDDNEKVFTEQLWLESPDSYATKSLDRLVEREVIVPDLLYRQLLVANSSEKIENILLSLGIDLSKTSLTRFDGVISYQIGDKAPESPKLIVEKERFLPLMIMYRIPDETENRIIRVSFKDYRKKEKGWYPFQITYKEGETLTEEYTIQTFQANIPVDASILIRFPEYEIPETPEPDMEPERVDSELSDSDKERLRNVIKAFEDQYQ